MVVALAEAAMAQAAQNASLAAHAGEAESSAANVMMVLALTYSSPMAEGRAPSVGPMRELSDVAHMPFARLLLQRAPE